MLRMGSNIGLAECGVICTKGGFYYEWTLAQMLNLLGTQQDPIDQFGWLQ